MKILAATPVQYGRTVYIAELTAEEITALTALSPYETIPVKSVTGQNHDRDRDKMQLGDEIDPAIARKAIDEIHDFRKAREEIAKSCNTLRGALTKLQHTLPATQ